MNSKRFAIILLSVLMIMIATRAEGRELSNAEAIGEGVYLALHVADWVQTRQIAANCSNTNVEIDKDIYRESNFFLGSCPSLKETDRYFMLTGIGHYLITRYLDEYRSIWLINSISIEAIMVFNNKSRFNLSMSGLDKGAIVGIGFVYSYKFE